jgi:MSHA biogenesis protein MshJ
MKQFFLKLMVKLDALNLRERALVFAGLAVVLVFLLKAVLLDGQFDQQQKLSKQIGQDQAKIAEMQRDIQSRIQAYKQDPDQVNQEKLQQVRAQTVQLRNDLMSEKRNLIAPEKMSRLLEDILKRNGRLRLVSLKTLPLVSLGSDMKETEIGGAKPEAAAKAAPSEVGSIYRHGVEIVVQGNYLDMMHYLTALEAMPWELYWGKASLRVETYPVATLSLTVYTLSLDKSWLNL